MKTKLNILLKKSDMTRDEIAKKLFISKSSLNKYAEGKVDPSFEMLLRICDILECTPNDIFGIETKNNMSKEEYNELIRIRDSLNKIIK